MMSIHTAVGIAEGFIEADSEEEVIQAWQFLVDTGTVWNLQGWFGRQAMAMIDAGILNSPFPSN